jgi:RNA polymerase sigma-70 factor (ECF subfamily)
MAVRPADIEDLTQDVLMILWRRWDDFDATRPLRPWIAGIAFRVAREHLRRRERAVPQQDIEAADGASNAEDLLISFSAQALLHRGLARVPPKYREIIALHDLEGVPIPELAKTLALPVFTTYSRLRYARQALAKAVKSLSGSHDEDRRAKAARRSRTKKG